VNVSIPGPHRQSGRYLHTPSPPGKTLKQQRVLTCVASSKLSLLLHGKKTFQMKNCSQKEVLRLLLFARRRWAPRPRPLQRAGRPAMGQSRSLASICLTIGKHSLEAF